MTNWFDVNRKGLAQLLDGRSKSFVLYELCQNAWDSDATEVNISLGMVPGHRKAFITVSDNDPKGFTRLSDAWTLYAPSERKGDVKKRGRYAFGEKAVLSLCYDAVIETVSGSVFFDENGRHEKKYPKRQVGSEFRGTFRMTKAEFEEVCESVNMLIPSANVTTVFNGRPVLARKRLRSFEATLPTLLADEEGFLRRTERQTAVNVYEPVGSTGWLYEMGIPVVPTGDRFDVEIAQKVPLNADRDNVTPAYLRQVRTLVVNQMHDLLNEDDANATMVNEALADKDASQEAVEKALTLKYGEKRAIFDPNDKEANMNLVSQGYNLIHGSQLTGKQWENVRRFGAAKPSGQLAPTKKAEFSPGGKDSWLSEDKWTPAIKTVIRYTTEIGQKLLGHSIQVGIMSDVTLFYGACFGGNSFVFNLGRLGHKFFERGISDQLNSLIIHELSHFFSPSHLDEAYHEALCNLGAKMTRLALDNPAFFRRNG